MRLRCVLLAALALGALAGPAQAEQRRVALVIANSKYQYTQQLPRLANTLADGHAIAAELKKRGFEVEEADDLGRRAMNAAVHRFTERLSAGSVALFYYSGHGSQIKGENYLLPIDLKPPPGAQAISEEDVADDAISLSQLVAEMKAFNDGFNLAIVDACRDNNLAAAGRGFARRGLAAPTTARGAMIVFAADADQEAIDGVGGAKNGLFTGELLKVMQVPGLGIGEAVARVKIAVAAQARKVGATQNPAIYDASTGDFMFTPPADTPSPAPSQAAVPPAPAPPAFDARQIELAYWDSIKDSKDIADFQDYLKQYPKGSFAPLARNRIRALKQADQPAPAAPEKVAIVAPPAPPRPAGGQPAPGRSFRDCADCPEMVAVPPGEFQMGDTLTPFSRPIHRVRVAHSFSVGKYDVTFEEWDACARDGGCRNGVSDSGWGRGRRPVVNVDWNDAKAYATWLSRKTGKSYRLLTEAEWEYAARGGRGTAYWWGDDPGSGNANCDGCGSQWDNKQTAPVGSFRPNPFGLYDMAGNVFQWTEDCWTDNYNSAPNDASIAVASGGDCGSRVVRGGSWVSVPGYLRAGLRIRFVTGLRGDFLGFRVARTL